jgi:hypothetical protein
MDPRIRIHTKMSWIRNTAAGRPRPQLQLRAPGAPRLHPLSDLTAPDQRRTGEF